MNVKRRLEALERMLISEPLTLFFEDGSSVQICGRGDYVLGLMGAACRNERSQDLELIARSVRSEEPGGGHLLDLVRAILQGPGVRGTSGQPQRKEIASDISS